MTCFITFGTVRRCSPTLAYFRGPTYSLPDRSSRSNLTLNSCQASPYLQKETRWAVRALTQTLRFCFTETTKRPSGFGRTRKCLTEWHSWQLGFLNNKNGNNALTVTTVLQLTKLTTWSDRIGNDRIASNIHVYFSNFIIIANSLEPGETPSNSASHKAPDYLPLYFFSWNSVLYDHFFKHIGSDRNGSDRIGSDRKKMSI